MEDALCDISEGMWQEIEIHQMNRVRDENLMSSLAYLMIAETRLQGKIIDLEHVKRHIEFRWNHEQCGHAFIDKRVSKQNADSEQKGGDRRGKKHTRASDEDTLMARPRESQKKRNAAGD